MASLYRNALELLYISIICSLLCCLTLAGELTFELPDNEKQCFHEDIDKDVKCTIEFQVVTGGNYDVDMELTSPNGEILYKDVKKQYDSFTWTTKSKGTYKFCFGNEFSSFTHKVVYLDFQVGDERPIVPDIGQQSTAMTMMETASVTIHEALKVVIDYQTHHRLRELTGRGFAEDINERVMLLSVIVSVVILLSSIGQVVVLRSFFSEKKIHGVSTKT